MGLDLRRLALSEALIAGWGSLDAAGTQLLGRLLLEQSVRKGFRV